MFVFDTDVLSNMVGPRPSSNLVDLVSSLPDEQRFTTSITVSEIIYGAYKSDRTEHFLRLLYEDILVDYRVLNFDQISAEIFGRTRAELELQGMPLAEPDLRIASIAMANDMTLVSGNTRHFSRVPGLRLENWL